MTTQLAVGDRSTPPPGEACIPRPLAAGTAWAALLAAVGVVYLVAYSLWQRTIADADNVPLASRDQLWSLILLATAGFVAGATLAAVRRRFRGQTAQSEPC